MMHLGTLKGSGCLTSHGAIPADVSYRIDVWQISHGRRQANGRLQPRGNMSGETRFAFMQAMMVPKSNLQLAGGEAIEIVVSEVPFSDLTPSDAKFVVSGPVPGFED